MSFSQNSNPDFARAAAFVRQAADGQIGQALDPVAARRARDEAIAVTHAAGRVARAQSTLARLAGQVPTEYGDAVEGYARELDEMAARIATIANGIGGMANAFEPGTIPGSMRVTGPYGARDGVITPAS